MAQYNQSGGIITIARPVGNKISKIPAGCYTVEFDMQMQEFFLQSTAPFTVPSKVYGQADNRAAKVLNTFMDREGKNTGVLLSGTKGSGKTQLAKDVSNMLLEQGVPTILVQNAYTGGTFINFIKAIEDKAMILFDEFEKVYIEREQQESILTLLDGTGSYNKLYVLTSNNRNVSEFLRNRPSRIYYHFEYQKLSKQTMHDLIADKLVNKTDKLLSKFNLLWDVADTLSFDVIQCLIEELNRYPEQDFVQTFRELNVEVDTRNSAGAWECKSLVIDGQEMKIMPESQDHTSSFAFMSKFDTMRSYFLLDEGVFESELKAVGAKVYDSNTRLEYCDDEICWDDDDDDEGQPVPESSWQRRTQSITELEYFMDFGYEKGDTRVSQSRIEIHRVINEKLVTVVFERGEELDSTEQLFGDK